MVNLTVYTVNATIQTVNQFH